MTRSRLALKSGALAACLLAVSACANRPPENALNRQCDMGGRHGPTGILEYRCTDGDGEVRQRAIPIHRLLRGGRNN